MILARLGEQSWTDFGERNIVVSNGVGIFGVLLGPRKSTKLFSLSLKQWKACVKSPMK